MILFNSVLSHGEVLCILKLIILQILLTRIRFFIDPGYPYEEALSTNRTDLTMCSYLSNKQFSMTEGD